MCMLGCTENQCLLSEILQLQLKLVMHNYLAFSPLVTTPITEWSAIANIAEEAVAEEFLPYKELINDIK